MPPRQIRYAPREVALVEVKDPLRWCKVGRHVPVRYSTVPLVEICSVCKTQIATVQQFNGSNVQRPIPDLALNSEAVERLNF